jgi:hypothetical protein
MPCPSHPPWLDHSNYTWRRVQVMKLLIHKKWLSFETAEDWLMKTHLSYVFYSDKLVRRTALRKLTSCLWASATWTESIHSEAGGTKQVQPIFSCVSWNLSRSWKEKKITAIDIYGQGFETSSVIRSGSVGFLSPEEGNRDSKRSILIWKSKYWYTNKEEGFLD